MGTELYEAAPTSMQKLSAWVILVFWSVQFSALTFLSFIKGDADVWQAFPVRFAVTVFGIVLSFGLAEMARRKRALSLKRRSLLIVGLGVASWLLVSGMEIAVFITIDAMMHFRRDDSDFIWTLWSWFWFFFAVIGALLAIAFGDEIRLREARWTEMELSARDSRLQALRYQLNPHFLFNTLNSVAALIHANENTLAESMTESLSDFLRTTLEMDPTKQIALAKEIELQSLYLAIEKTRFDDRIKVVYSVEPAALDCLIPALITQPAIENVIRHAVARSRAAIHLTIEAVVEADRLVIKINNDGRQHWEIEGGTERIRLDRGTGVGLTNIQARLRARYGDDHEFFASKSDFGYLVSLSIPAQYAQ